MPFYSYLTPTEMGYKNNSINFIEDSFAFKRNFVNKIYKKFELYFHINSGFDFIIFRVQGQPDKERKVIYGILNVLENDNVVNNKQIHFPAKENLKENENEVSFSDTDSEEKVFLKQSYQPSLTTDDLTYNALQEYEYKNESNIRLYGERLYA